MATMTLRGLDERTTLALKEKACKEGLSVNTVVLRLVREALGIERKKRMVYDDLDHLAGTWSEEDAAQFEQATAAFEKVDEEMWK